jgi:hypothetical protein
MKKIIVIFLTAVLLISAFACAAPKQESTAVSPMEPSVAPSPVPAPTVPATKSYGNDSVYSYEESPAYGAVAYDGDASIERMIVQTGNLALVVTDVAVSMSDIVSLAESYDGYVVSSNSWRENSRLVGVISIRVPAERFDDAIGALRQMAVEVDSESTSSTDVTEEYVDLSARLRNLEASEQQLLALMEKAGSVEEILQVQRELTSTRSQIEQTKGRMQYLEQTSSTSYLEVRLEQAALNVTFSANRRTVKAGENIRFSPEIGGGISPYSYEWDFGDGSTSTEVSPAHSYKSAGNYNVSLKVTDDKGQTDIEERSNYIDVLPGWSASNTFNSAWSGLITFGHGLVNVLIWIAVLIPVWAVIIVILYFAWWRRRKKA